tara:strand:- start:1783 stop:2127 length:345 start_codon:yes stop_codon:yes gene_type:complete
MTSELKEKPSPLKKEEEQIKFDPSKYSCEIILEKTTIEKANDTSFPTDAFNVSYVLDGQKFLDVTRSEKMVNVFDLYYDKYGKDVVKKIEYGAGTIRPNLWRLKSPTTKKKRKV